MKNALLSKKLVIPVLGLLTIGALIYIVVFVLGSTSGNDNFSETENRSDKVSISNSQNTNKNSGHSGNSANLDSPPANPYGNFISNHEISMSSEAANNINSVCQTSTGAKCTVRFIKDNQMKQLPQKEVDDTGSVEWYWSLEEVGITEGEWTVEAVASNGTHEVVVKDPIKLRVES